ncbi:hypothetical protein [Halorubrum hochstenium]|uniref:hypothetical protein n=1 Tax=Halorubrum hochstenium TaxID=1227480 RepID=UPI00178C7111|nr:hypothetical protein [Halorubrum hochstenium]
MLAYSEAGSKPREDVGLMRFAREHRQPAVPDRDDPLARPLRCVTTTRAVDAAGRAVIEEVGATVGREPAERPELLQMVVTSDERDRQPVEQQKREAAPSR